MGSGAVHFLGRRGIDHTDGGQRSRADRGRGLGGPSLIGRRVVRIVPRPSTSPIPAGPSRCPQNHRSLAESLQRSAAPQLARDR